MFTFIRMKVLMIITLLVSSSFSFAQSKPINGLISNAEFKVLYRGYKNQMELVVCKACDSIFIFSSDAEINRQDEVSFSVKPKAGTRNLTLTVNCINGMDTTELWSERYIVRALPKPKIYLGGIDINSDFNHIKEMNLFAQKRFAVRYDMDVYLTNIKFSLTEWSIKVGKRTFTNSNQNITAEFKEAFKKAKKGTAIYFDYVSIMGPDGVAQKINLNQTYYKKAKRNADYGVDPNQDRYLYPESGG